MPPDSISSITCQIYILSYFVNSALTYSNSFIVQIDIRTENSTVTKMQCEILQVSEICSQTSSIRKICEYEAGAIKTKLCNVQDALANTA